MLNVQISQVPFFQFVVPVAQGIEQLPSKEFRHFIRLSHSVVYQGFTAFPHYQKYPLYIAKVSKGVSKGFRREKAISAVLSHPSKESLYDSILAQSGGVFLTLSAVKKLMSEGK